MCSTSSRIFKSRSTIIMFSTVRIYLNNDLKKRKPGIHPTFGTAKFTSRHRGLEPLLVSATFKSNNNMLKNFNLVLLIHKEHFLIYQILSTTTNQIIYPNSIKFFPFIITSFILTISSCYNISFLNTHPTTTLRYINTSE